MKNTLLKKFKRLYYKYNKYKTPKFPYDMRKVILYANSVGKQINQLTDSEMKMFLL